jgi:hypothetical protein
MRNIPFKCIMSTIITLFLIQFIIKNIDFTRCDWKKISEIAYNITITLGALFGGIYTFYVFQKRQEEASLDIKITSIKKLPRSNKRNIAEIIICVENNGKRDLNLDYDSASITIFNIILEQTLKTEAIHTINSLKPIINNHKGKIRRGVKMNIPYLFNYEPDKLYLVEFKIEVDMIIFTNIFNKDESKNPIWSDRIVFNPNSIEPTNKLDN